MSKRDKNRQRQPQPKTLSNRQSPQVLSKVSAEHAVTEPTPGNSADELETKAEARRVSASDLPANQPGPSQPGPHAPAETAFPSLHDALAAREAALQARENDANTRQKELLDWSKQLEAKQASQVAGVVSDYYEATARAATELRQLSDSAIDLIANLAQAQRTSLEAIGNTTASFSSALQEDFNSISVKLREQMNAQLEAVAEKQASGTEKQASIEKQLVELKAAKTSVENERFIVEIDRANLAKSIAERSQKLVDDKNKDLAILQARLDNAREHVQQLSEEVAKLRSIEARLTGRPIEDVASENENLKKEIRELRGKIGSQLQSDERTRLDDLEQMASTWAIERSDLSRQIGELKRQLSQRDVLAVESEVQRDEIRVKTKIIAALKEQSKTLEDQLTSKTLDQDEFAECVRMDKDVELQVSRSTQHIAAVNLAKLVAQIRDAIAWGNQTQDNTGAPLFYSKADIRSFLAGIAMGQLTILEGISGTGKSSLPFAFAQAIGGVAHVVPVQSGWRDRQDLIGFFNAFEHRYYESDFLKHLYRAQTPRWKDRLVIIVLDEMNLSYVEQYFADVLSAMETRGDAPSIEIMSRVQINRKPNLFDDSKNSLRLRLPMNVHFAGTANRDETTRTIADKTYDRAHILELPARHKISDRTKSEHVEISYTALSQAFKNACDETDNLAEAQKLLDILQVGLRDELAAPKLGGIGWGSRLERQIKRYVPVTMAAGGSFDEAADYILSSKVLRKLKGKRDIEAVALQGLRDKIASVFDKKSNLPKTFALLEAEIGEKR